MKVRSELLQEKRYLNNLMKSTKDYKTQRDIFGKLSKIKSDLKYWEKKGF